MFRLPARSLLRYGLSRTFFSWQSGEIGGFTSHTIHAPHSRLYLMEQIEKFEAKGLSAKITSLKKGTRFRGLNTISDILYGAAPVYPIHLFKASEFSPREISYMQEQFDSYGSKIAEFILTEDIECVVTETEYKHPKYYIHSKFIRMEDNLIDFPVFLEDSLEPTYIK